MMAMIYGSIPNRVMISSASCCRASSACSRSLAYTLR